MWQLITSTLDKLGAVYVGELPADVAVCSNIYIVSDTVFLQHVDNVTLSTALTSLMLVLRNANCNLYFGCIDSFSSIFTADVKHITIATNKDNKLYVVKETLENE